MTSEKILSKKSDAHPHPPMVVTLNKESGHDGLVLPKKSHCHFGNKGSLESFHSEIRLLKRNIINPITK